MRLCNIAERLFIAEAPPALEHFQLLGIYMQIWMPCYSNHELFQTGARIAASYLSSTNLMNSSSEQQMHLKPS